MSKLNNNKKPTANMISGNRYIEKEKYEEDFIPENLTYWISQSQIFNNYEVDEYLEKEPKYKIKNRKHESQIKNIKYKNEVKNMDKEKYYSNEQSNINLNEKDILINNVKIYESTNQNKKLVNSLLAIDSSK
eukprot:snap_masked-scaffold_33-processed-gene-1.4-mRNA-1 protein AED:1.00 eAED:1.00 QI:0/-1/0/0/-1/1/1/0/131